MGNGNGRTFEPQAAGPNPQARSAGNALEEYPYLCHDANRNVAALVETDAAEEGRKAVRRAHGARSRSAAGRERTENSKVSPDYPSPRRRPMSFGDAGGFLGIAVGAVIILILLALGAGKWFAPKKK